MNGYSAEPPGLVHLQYGYDRASNRTHRADLIAQFYEKDFDELYEYDGLHRLKKFHRGRLAEGDAVIEAPTLQQGWRLDATGNWRNFTQAAAGDPGQTLDQQRTSNRVNEITAIARSVGPNWATPSYDRNGNMTVIPQPKAMTETYQATWDAWNRLVKLEEPDGGDGWQPLAEYQYDGQTWRTLAKSYAAGSLDETRHTYFSSQWQALEERLGATPASAPPERQFVWGLRYIDDLALRDRDTDDSGSLDERLYAMQDGNWNVVATNSDQGRTVERVAYNAYGLELLLTTTFDQRTQSQADVDIGFAGYPLDRTSGLNCIRLRYYSSSLACWTSRDLLPGYSQYWYVSSNPTNLVDPSGLEEIDPVLKGNTSYNFYIEDGSRFFASKSQKFDIFWRIHLQWGSICAGKRHQFSLPPLSVDVKIYNSVSDLALAKLAYKTTSVAEKLFSFTKDSAPQGGCCQTDCSVFAIVNSVEPRGIEVKYAEIVSQLFKQLTGGVSDTKIAELGKNALERLLKSLAGEGGFKIAAGNLLGSAISMLVVCANGEKEYYRVAAGSAVYGVLGAFEFFDAQWQNTVVITPVAGRPAPIGPPPTREQP